jgi:peptidoglycan hydrolase CwlO-like protein
MQLESFQKLEQKINQVLELVDRVKEENKQVSSSYGALSAKVFETEQKNKNLEAENSLLKAQIKGKEGSIKNIELNIKRRIENLLSRLEAIE